MTSENRYKAYIIAAIIAVSLVQGLWLFKGSVFDNVDSGLINYIGQASYLTSLYNSFFIWTTLNYTGFITSTGSPIGIFLSVIDLLIVTPLGEGIGSGVYFGLLIAAGNLGIFFLIYKVLDKYPIRARAVSGFLGIAIFSFYTAVNNGPGYNLTGTFLPLSIFFTYLLYRHLEQHGTKLTSSAYLGTIFFLILSLAALFAFGGDAYAIQDVLEVSIIMLVLVAFSSKKKKVFFIFLAVLLLAIAINASMYSTAALFTGKVGNQFFNSGSIAIIHDYNYQNIFTSLQLYAQTNYLYEYYELSYFILAIASLFFAIEAKEREKKAMVISVFVAFFFILLIWDNFSPPFGAVFSFLINHIKELLVFRYSGSSLYYLVQFAYAFLAGIGSGFLYGKISVIAKDQTSRKVVLSVFSIFVISLILVVAYYGEYNSYKTYSGITIPQHVDKIAAYINSHNGYFNVAALPVQAPFYHFDTWYKGTDIYSYLVDKSVFPGGYNSQNELFFPSSYGEYFGAASSEQNPVPKNYSSAFQNIFGVLGIRYVIVQGDSIVGTTGFSANAMVDNLDNDTEMKMVFSSGPSKVYESSNYVPLVYASNLDIIQSNTTSGIYAAISNSSFEIQNYSVYDPASFDGYSPIGKMVAYEVRPFSKPNVSFDYANPTYVVVHVSNATTPFYLVFRESYDPSWSAYFSNGTEISPSDHLLVNGFANAWYIDAKGSYTIHIYYALQTYADIAWVVSFAALFATLGIGVYGWKESKMAKARVKKRK